MKNDRFVVSALVDFPDDCGNIVFTQTLVENLMERLQSVGVTRVYWNFYQAGMWDFFGAGSEATRETLGNFGEPVAVGARAARERGLEFWATIKPYETGASHSNPGNSPKMLEYPGLPGIGGEYTVDPWVLHHPEMRLKIRSADLPRGLEKVPIRRIQLRQKDMAPVRIKPENIEIWTSGDNVGYRRKEVSFDVSESVETCPREVVEIQGGPVTGKGESVRALDLTGLDLFDPFIAVTTNLDDDGGTFSNTALEMVRAFGPEDREFPVVVASHKAIWRPERDLRTDDLEYDCGIGDVVACLDVANSRNVTPGWFGTGSTRDGVIAVGRGRNEYVSGALCEAYPEVRDYWLDWVGACIAAGVDGVDVRISNHSSWVNVQEIYGFNKPVAEEYERRYGSDPDTGYFDPELLGAVRGEFFDRFLRAAKARLSAAGKKLSVHTEMEGFRPDSCQARWRSMPNIIFNWRNWLRSGLADEATLFGRAWNVDRLLEDPLTQEMLGEAAAAGVPVHMNNPVGHHAEEMSDPEKLEYSYNKGGLGGYCFYETAAMYDGAEPVSADGTLNFRPGLLESIRETVDSLGLGG